MSLAQLAAARCSGRHGASTRASTCLCKDCRAETNSILGAMSESQKASSYFLLIETHPPTRQGLC